MDSGFNLAVPWQPLVGLIEKIRGGKVYWSETVFGKPMCFTFMDTEKGHRPMIWEHYCNS